MARNGIRRIEGRTRRAAGAPRILARMAARLRVPGEDADTVYSTAKGGPPPAKPPERKPAPAARGSGALPRDGVVRVRREIAGRRGRPVTTIHGLPLGEGALRELASELKRRLGTGGSAKDGVIEIQGDHRDAVLAELTARGYTAVRAGG
jgi:translation initiation factor 1